jgi:hypothetical protein
MRRAETEIAALLQALCGASARLIAQANGCYAISAEAETRPRYISSRRVRALLAQGLLEEAEGGGLTATSAAAAWLKRRNGGDLSFRAQHDDIARISVRDDGDREVLANLDESPVAALARRSGRSGRPLLPPHAAAAAERLRRDFEIGRLQPRVTANWSASVSDGRRTGDNSGLAELTDMALGARLRFDRAMRAVGPELSGVLVDICCFLKGLETVERERQWPARSAKLVLRLALERLARHYGYLPAATGKSASGHLRHWGADDYRPEIS